MSLRRLHLYQGPSGPELLGNDGDVLTFDAATKAWKALPASGGGGAPPPTVRYVAQGAAGGGDGSAGAPYATLAAAIADLDALAVLDNTKNYVALVFPGDYSAETLPAWTTAATLAIISATLSPSTLGFIKPLIPGCVGAGGLLNLVGVAKPFGVADFTLFSNTTLSDAYYNGTLACGDLAADGSQLFATTITCTLLTLDDCVVAGSDGGNTPWSITSGNAAAFKNTRFSGDQDIDFPGTGGTLEIDGYSNYYYKLGGGNLTGGTKTITEDTTP